jgi:pentatricopeptide repeat protein
MKKLYCLFILAYCVPAVLVSVSCAGSGEKIDLKLSLEQGKTYKLRTINDVKMTQTFQGREMEMSQKMTFDFTFEVQAVDDGGDATVEVTYHSIAVEMEGPMGKVEYDSTNPTETETPMVKGFAALAGQSYTMVISTMGEVKKVEGMKEIMDRMIESLDLPEEQRKEAIRGQFENMFGDQAAVEMMGQMFVMFPDRPVGVGDAWSKTITMTKGMPMTVEHDWTLKERKDGIAVLADESVIKSNPDAGPMDMGPMKITMDIAGEQSGTVELDESTGWIVGGRMTYRVSGEQKIEGPAEETSQSIPLSMEATITWEQF